jgi:hypothetical protein
MRAIIGFLVVAILGIGLYDVFLNHGQLIADHVSASLSKTLVGLADKVKTSIGSLI